MDAAAIKTMQLYSRVERIYDDLRHAGIADHDPLTVEALSAFDQYHYFGTAAVDEAIRALDIGPHSRVLDVGSGLGGPARVMAQRSGCRVTALELQADLDRVGQSLTARCGLAGKVDHVRGDVLATDLAPGGHHAVVSWLALYHIADPARLFARLAHAVAPGGGLYVEDFYRLGDLTGPEQAILEGVIYAQSLPTREAYIATVEAAGFGDVRFTDMTAPWAAFVRERASAYRARLDDHAAVHGAEVAGGLDAFYQAVVKLFDGGRFAGLRLTAKRTQE